MYAGTNIGSTITIDRLVVCTVACQDIYNLHQTRRTYNMLKAETDLGNSYDGLNWTSNIKHILDEIGMSNLWIQHNGLDIKFAPIKQRIIDTFTQD